jgi:hypothetical protein
MRDFQTKLATPYGVVMAVIGLAAMGTHDTRRIASDLSARFVVPQHTGNADG